MDTNNFVKFMLDIMTIPGAICVGIFVYICYLAITTRSFQLKSGEGDSLTPKVVLDVFHNWTRAYAEANPRYLPDDWVSGQFADSFHTDMDMFAERGYRKVTKLIPHDDDNVREVGDPNDPLASLDIVYVRQDNGCLISVLKTVHMNDGKNEALMLSVSFNGQTYLVNSKGKKIGDAKTGLNSILMTFVKSANRKPITEQTCKSCLNPISQHGDRFICEYCGSVYNINDYDWNLAYATAQESGHRESWKQTTLSVLTIVPLILTFIPYPLINWIAGGFFVLLMTPFLFKVKKMNSHMKLLTTSDPEFSADGLVQRADAIIHRVKDARRKQKFENVSKYVTPELFANIKTAKLSGMADPDAYYTFRSAGATGFHVKGDYEYAEVAVGLRMRNLRTRRRKANTTLIEMRRKKGTKTKSVVGVTDIDCPNCKASIDISSVNFCEYCGTEIQVENYDWVLSGARKSKGSILWV